MQSFPLKVLSNQLFMVRIPLPELKDSDKLDKIMYMKESTKRIRLGRENLPSICFYTFLNAYQVSGAHRPLSDGCRFSLSFRLRWTCSGSDRGGLHGRLQPDSRRLCRLHGSGVECDAKKAAQGQVCSRWVLGANTGQRQRVDHADT